MTAIPTALRKFLSNVVTSLMRGIRCVDPRTELITQLRAAQLKPACLVPGIEHQAAAAILRIGLPTVEHQRCTVRRDRDEHLFLDTVAQAGVRVVARWVAHEHRVRMYVAEVGDPRMWDRIVNRFTTWEYDGRPVPAGTVNGVPS